MPIARCHSYEISHNRFHADADKLTQVLGKIMAKQPPVQPVELLRQPTVDKPDETKLPFEPEMVRIKPGKFLMGSPETEGGRNSDEGPQHKPEIKAAMVQVFFILAVNFVKCFDCLKRKSLHYGKGKRK